MAEIRYVCLSDLHLGEEDSVLSNLNEDGTEGDASKPGPILEQLALCIKDLRDKLWKTKKPILVLNGDALELALCPLHRASMAFQCFINELKEGDDFLFERILFLPGNHDHHIWVMTRENQYQDYLNRHKEDLTELPEQWHSTKLFSSPGDPAVVSHFLTDLIARPPVNLNMKVQVAYPNFGVFDETELNPGREPEKCLVFHHGHFTEWIYTAVSTLNHWIFDSNGQFGHAWEVEKENFAWIDFAWSALGQSWARGQGLETVYEKALDDKEFGQVIANVAAGLAKEFGTRTLDGLEATAIEKGLSLLYRSFAGTEKGQADTPLTSRGIKQLFQYVEGPLHAQICYDILAWQLQKNQLDEKKYAASFFKEIPAPRTTLVLGHTHKPFARHEAFQGYRGGVDVYNSGGWIVEDLDAKRLHGGSIILADAQLNVAAIRMYNETADDAPRPVWCEALPVAAPSLNPLSRDLEKVKFSKNEVWKTFSQKVTSAVSIRRKFLRKRVFSALSRPR